jgi:hypothetical protein
MASSSQRKSAVAWARSAIICFSILTVSLSIASILTGNNDRRSLANKAFTAGTQVKSEQKKIEYIAASDRSHSTGHAQNSIASTQVRLYADWAAGFLF